MLVYGCIQTYHCRLQFAAIVYEHPNQAIRKALLTAIEAQDGEDTEYVSKSIISDPSNPLNAWLSYS